MRNTYSQKKAVPVVRLVTEPGYASARETPQSLINDLHMDSFVGVGGGGGAGYPRFLAAVSTRSRATPRVGFSPR